MLSQLVKEPFFGFDPAAIKFLKQLTNPKNNSKEWFDKNRDIYETHLKQPMKDLIDNLAVEINKIDTDIVVNYKSIFRINRDIRFSKDKTPYKNYYSAAFAFYKVKSAEIPHFYFQFNSSEFLFAGGQYTMDNSNLKKIRYAIKVNFKKYKAIINNKNFVKAFGDVRGESLKNMPKGFVNMDLIKQDALLISSLKLKQFYVYKTYKPDLIFDEKIVDIILENIKITYDFTKFLSEAIK